MYKKALIRIALCAILLELCYLLFLWQGNPVSHPLLFYGLYFSLFILFLSSFQILRRGTIPQKQAMRIIWILSVVFRITLFFYKPLIDVFTPGFLPIPGFLGPVTTYHMKLFILLADLGLIWIIIKLLKAEHIQTQSVVLYAWNPLVLLLFCGMGTPLIFGLLVFFSYLLLQRVHILLPMFLSLCVFFLYGPVPVAFFLVFCTLPYAFLRQAISTSVKLVFITGFIIIMSILIYGGFALLLPLAQKTMFNSFLFTLLGLSAKNNSAFVFISLLGISFFPLVIAQKSKNLFTYFIAIIGVFLLFSPFTTPAIFVLLIPSLCFKPKGSWLLLNATIILYFTHLLVKNSSGTLQLPPGIWTLEYIPFAVYIVYELGMKKIKKG